MSRLGARHRRRWLLGSRWATVLPWLGFRYDHRRSSSKQDAYLLRGIGKRFGPVFLVKRRRMARPEVSADASAAIARKAAGDVPQAGEDRTS